MNTRPLNVRVGEKALDRLCRRLQKQKKRARAQGDPMPTLGMLVTRAIEHYLAATVVRPRPPLERPSPTSETAVLDPYDPRDPHPCDGMGPVTP